MDLRHLNGPNVFASSPVSVAGLELDELTCKETTDFGGFADRLTMLLPGLAGHHCAAGRPGGFLDAMTRGTYFGHVCEHVALELSGLAGREVHLGRTMWAGAEGRYDLMMECPPDEPDDSEVPRALLELAIRVVQDVLAQLTPELHDDLARISAMAERERLGISTAALAAAARRRGVPVRRIGRGSLLQLGYGCHRQLVCAALTSQTSAVGVDIAADKKLSKQLLAAAGIPVPDGIVAWSPEEAAAAAEEIGGPVVVKPLGGSQGANVTIGVRTAAQAAAAYAKAAAAGDAVLVEAMLPGTDYRVLVIDGRVAAAAELRPASVTGDGEHTIGQLVAIANADPRRGRGHSRELTQMKLDAEAIGHLDALGLDDHSVPALGQLVTLRRNANLSTGGTSKDVTEKVHPEVADMCRRAAAVSGLDVCGVDLRLADIAAPLTDPDGHGRAGPGGVLELNACPGLRMHLSPTEGTPRDVAGAVLDSLYPPGAQARIPVVSVTGTNGKTSTVRMVGHVLRQAGLRVGVACTDGVHIGGRLVYAADASGPRSAEMVLGDPGVEAAVLETARGGIVRRGLGYDQADVAVVTNISADHLGDDGIDDLDELIHVKALVAEEIREGGSVVLNADDPATAALADRAAVRRRAPVIRFFSLEEGNERILRHRQAGGRCYEVIDGQLTETEAGERRPVIAIDELPGAFGGKARHVVANALAAIAACRAVGVSAKEIRHGLASFTPEEANPGRGNIYRAAGSPVLVDYGHNAAALRATGQFVSDVWGGEPVAVVTLPGDRREDLLTQTAAEVAARFGKVVLYEDSDKRGREPGEMAGLIAAALRQARPGIQCQQAEDPAGALRAALSMAGGAPVLFVYEKLAMAREALAAVGAQPWPEASRPAHTDSVVAVAESMTAEMATAITAAAAAEDPAGAEGSGGAGEISAVPPTPDGTALADAAGGGTPAAGAMAPGNMHASAAVMQAASAPAETAPGAAALVTDTADGAALVEGPVLTEDTVLPENTVLTQDTALPENTVLPQETVLPQQASPAQDTVLAQDKVPADEAFADCVPDCGCQPPESLRRAVTDMGQDCTAWSLTQSDQR
ncbi:MAG TPA: cyanophycin synthetase [Streptosporangiaceae bacterium]|nr:cyanophycin synthetase [Streptosporangiaceae bacterium]